MIIYNMQGGNGTRESSHSELFLSMVANFTKHRCGIEIYSHCLQHEVGS